MGENTNILREKQRLRSCPTHTPSEHGLEISDKIEKAHDLPTTPGILFRGICPREAF